VNLGKDVGAQLARLGRLWQDATKPVTHAQAG